ncbi:MAG: hypothetical protein WBZ35_24645, partial [Pseudolabrys sp.]
VKISVEFYAVMARAVISRQLIELRIELQISFMPSAWSPNPQSRSWRNHKGLPSTGSMAAPLFSVSETSRQLFRYNGRRSTQKCAGRDLPDLMAR